MFGRLITGESPMRIAAWIQANVPSDDPLGVASTRYDALWRRLYRFRAKLPPAVLIARGYMDQKFASVEAGIDVLAEFDTLIRLQKSRISGFVEKEEKFPFPSEAMRREVATLGELLERRRDTAIALGYHPGASVPGTPLFVGGQNVQVNVGVAAMSPAGRKMSEILEAHPEAIAEFAELADKLEALEGHAVVVSESSGEVDDELDS